MEQHQVLDDCILKYPDSFPDFIYELSSAPVEGDSNNNDSNYDIDDVQNKPDSRPVEGDFNENNEFVEKKLF